MDYNEVVGALILDLSKAFDLVDHDILLEKLCKLNLDRASLSWFSSYLHDRFQQTYFSGVLSEIKPVMSGVPQGSVLGPVLFLIFINDLPNAAKYSIADIFADDTTLSVHSSSIDIVSKALSDDLDNVNEWCVLNHMSINVAKTKYMYLMSRSKSYSSDNQISFKSDIIKLSHQEKLLGVTFDDKLSFDCHINNVLKKCNSLLYLLSRIKIFLSIPMRKLFYNAYILPHLDYCCVVWGNCSVSHEQKIVRFKKRAARVILDKQFDTPSSELFK